MRAGDWKAAAWSLERTYPEFARQEVQIAVNNTLNQVNLSNTLVIKAEVAEVINKRQKEIYSKVEKLFEARRLKNASGNSASKKEPATEVEAEAEVVLPAITLPVGEPSTAWWASLSRGDEVTLGRLVRLLEGL